MSISDSTQVPLREPLYINGMLSNVWLMFFQKLASISNQADANGDILELTQLVHQLPINSLQAQQGFEIESIANMFNVIPINIEQQQEIPPVTAVFLCQKDMFIPAFPLPSSEIIYDQIQESI